jgi:RNA polymerase sigma-70 factor (ECF subfamily)
MILVCCHPRLKARESVAITLRYICGLKPPDIAGVLLLTEVGARKLLTRTKDKIRNRPIPFELPESDARKERLARVLQIIYLLFAEGYAANAGDQLVRQDLCEEAIRLCDLLQKTEDTATDGRVWALAALMRFQAARLPARSDATGHLVLLAEQDRRLWDQRQISEAFACLSRAIEGTQRSRYHLEAAIAACHATAADYEHTDWPRILSFYDDLALLAPSPVVALNRAVAVMMIDGPEVALEQLRPLEADRKLNHYPLLTSVLADFHRRAGHINQAEDYYRHALELTKNLPLKRFLSDQLNSLSIA